MDDVCTCSRTRGCNTSASIPFVVHDDEVSNQVLELGSSPDFTRLHVPNAKLMTLLEFRSRG